jgi:hypothetical protein
MTVPVLMGVEHWVDPSEQPKDRHTLQQYDVDKQVLARWRDAQKDYLQARAVLIREIERQGWRVTPRPRDGSHIDIVFDRGPGPDAPRLVEVEDDHGRSIRYGEWVERGDGYWVLRIPAARASWKCTRLVAPTRYPSIVRIGTTAIRR